MKRSFIHDQGTAEAQEDGIVNTHSIVGVLDGAGKPHEPDEELLLDSMPSGAWVARMAETQITNMVFNGRFPAILLHIVLEVNQALRTELDSRFGDLPNELRPGVTFAVAGIDKAFIQVAQVGDSFAFVRKKNGEICFSSYRMRAFEKEDQKLVLEAMSKAKKLLFGHESASVPENRRKELRKEFWRYYLDPWIQLRKEAINKPNSKMGYGLMNGDPEMLSFLWSRAFKIEEVELVLLLTDGMIPKSLLKKESDEEIAKGILNAYDLGGLNGILNLVRREEAMVVSANYIDQAESTGYALQF